MSGLKLVRASIDAYLEQFEHPTADDSEASPAFSSPSPSTPT
jgi:hypothetical protein